MQCEEDWKAEELDADSLGRVAMKSLVARLDDSSALSYPSTRYRNYAIHNASNVPVVPVLE